MEKQTSYRILSSRLLRTSSSLTKHVRTVYFGLIGVPQKATAIVIVALAASGKSSRFGKEKDLCVEGPGLTEK